MTNEQMADRIAAGFFRAIDEHPEYGFRRTQYYRDGTPQDLTAQANTAFRDLIYKVLCEIGASEPKAKSTAAYDHLNSLAAAAREFSRDHYKTPATFHGGTGATAVMMRQIMDAFPELVAEFIRTRGTHCEHKDVYRDIYGTCVVCGFRTNGDPQAEPKAQYQVHVQRNVIGLDHGFDYPKNVEHVPFGPVYDTEDAAKLSVASKGWMDIWWHVERLNREVPQK